MDIAIAIAWVLAGGGALVQAVTIALAASRLRVRGRARPPANPPPVTVIRPVSGLEPGLEAALRSGFALTWPRYELLICAEEETDAAVPLVRRLIAAHPGVRARLLVGRDPVGVSPKINNMAKGWNAATTEWIVLSDSNALLQPDLIEGLFERQDASTGVVSTATAGTAPGSFAAEIECAFLNTYQTRLAMAADTTGIGVVLGKTMLWRRDILEGLGGMARISEAADDIAARRVVRGAGLKTRLTHRPVRQALGRRSFADVWRRQVRWAQARRIPAKSIFYTELLSGGLAPMAAMAGLALAGAAPPLALPVFALAWYGGEAILTLIAGWPLSARTPFAWLARDLLIPAIWVAGWFGDNMAWRGHAVSVHPAEHSGASPQDRHGSDASRSPS